MSFVTKNVNWWFAKSGHDDDIILSTKVTLYRNLADFPFIRKMTDDDKLRVDSLIYDAFCKENYSFFYYDSLSESAKKVFIDNNILVGNCSSIIINNKDDSISCLTNQSDHLKISVFSPGLECENAAKKIYAVDEKIQEKLQFAASTDFGYLTSNLCNCGSGLKISVRMFIPSIFLSGHFPYIQNMLEEHNLQAVKVFASDENYKDDFSQYIIDIKTTNAVEGTEIDQIANIFSVCQVILKMERKICQEFADNNSTIILNFLRQKYYKALSSLLLTYEEACDLICSIKWGINLKLLKEIAPKELNSLFYLEKDSHLAYLCNNFSFKFEKDVKNCLELQIKRLRAIVIHQTIDEK